ncbi:MAG: hypothetical protein ACR5KV_01895 [Wolbachia sp.]
MACQNDKIESFCYPDRYYQNKEYNANFFDKNLCPNLIQKYGATNIIGNKSTITGY